MVYCGKPSRGCQMCRTRRIKCDETKPTCNQCAKSRRQCPGYKHDFDLVFRNETQATERRARKSQKAASQKLRNGQAGASSSSKDADAGSESQSAESVSKEVSITTPRNSRALQMAPDQQASCHFVSNFVMVSRQGFSPGWMNYLMPLLKIDRIPESLRLAFTACSFASIGNRVGGGNTFARMAIAQYTQALSATHKALQDPATALTDATLASTLLLGVYEAISANRIGSMAWGSHIEGAIQLVKARGRSQLKTKVGVMLFSTVRTQMIGFMHANQTPPTMSAEWWTSGDTHDTTACATQRLSIRVGELRAEVNRLLSTLDRTPDNIQLMLDLMRRCQMMDQELANWFHDAPPHYTYKTAAWEDNVPNGDYFKAEVYPGRVDLYQDLWVASVWNNVRTSRILLSSSIVRCAAWICAPIDYRTTPEYAWVSRIARETITDIIASVPYLLGWFSKRKHLLERTGLSSFGCGDEDAQKALPGLQLSWPLVCIQNQDFISDSERAWVKGRLHFINEQLGVRSAGLLGQLNLRMPSMLIRRDGTMANLTAGVGFEKMLRGKASNDVGSFFTARRGQVTDQGE
ncbi:Fungal Zn(2)-Cys(6) binuclear cluster domain [Geosmithia morbida]|uniref:Fungal Zn(2)-Cys(6) binuclear cluster domain n=1 Tax=Geosmithia morbida TaxID=1094350 RepID=A0A9P5D0F5_9HYPO|nr:Fungal Zn(2)-Cys(6) binuclear cluster domain [Geosmithia morbida]KAF4121547.1 Fungal Zn(2)-Cys(6) binuclear cluster domain [Geosmithia morbida]